LESLVGEESMNNFLKAYCEKFKFGVVNSYSWKEFFLSYFEDKAKELEEVKWDEWLKKPGMPPKPDFDTSLLNAANQLAIDLVEGKGQTTEAVDIADWSSHQIMVFLIKIEVLQKDYYHSRKPVTMTHREQFKSILEAIDAIYKFSETRNSEIRFWWLTVCIRAEMEPAMQAAVEFVKEQGRMKFIRPLYRDLFQSTKGKQLAIDTFQQNKHIYHGIASKMVSKDLKLS